MLLIRKPGFPQFQQEFDQMRKEIKHLEWDSLFFGFKVGKVEGQAMNQEELMCFSQEAKVENYVLLYLFLDTQIASDIVHRFGQITLIDKKVTYTQKVITSINWHSVKHSTLIRRVHEKQPSEKLIKLAIQSGEFSRFRLDERIEEGKFKELYVRWISNALSGQSTEEAWQWNENNETLGFITLSTKSDRVEIGLLAVDNYARGRGIGKALVKKALHVTYLRKIDLLQVVTQKQNATACRFYQNNGFSEQNVKFVYHLWL